MVLRRSRDTYKLPNKSTIALSMAAAGSLDILIQGSETDIWGAEGVHAMVVVPISPGWRVVAASAWRC